MATINDPNTAANVMQVAPVSTASAQYAARVLTVAIPHGSLGHYRSAIRLTMATSQAANSRLWEVRNTSTNLIIPTRLRLMAAAHGVVTASYLAQWDCYRCTTFTAVDTTNTVTPTASLKRTGMGASPGSAALRHATVAGVAAGMTGGTLTKDGGSFGALVLPAITATAGSPVALAEMLDDVNGTHPFILAQNEGLLIENTIVGSATANVLSIVVDFSWAEAAVF